MNVAFICLNVSSQSYGHFPHGICDENGNCNGNGTLPIVLVSRLWFVRVWVTIMYRCRGQVHGIELNVVYLPHNSLFIDLSPTNCIKQVQCDFCTCIYRMRMHVKGFFIDATAVHCFSDVI